MNQEIIAVILSIIAFSVSAIALYLNFQNNKKYKELTTGISGHNLERIVSHYVALLDKCTNDVERMNIEFEKIRKDTSMFFRKVGLVRFQAFEGTGGDQSFSLALLDVNNNGFILSGIYGRDMSKVYAKEIRGGKVSKYKLTDEEQEALKKALLS
ncbi:MAG: DUF4446 family protein [bacterium]